MMAVSMERVNEQVLKERQGVERGHLVRDHGDVPAAWKGDTFSGTVAMYLQRGKGDTLSGTVAMHLQRSGRHRKEEQSREFPSLSATVRGLTSAL